MLGMTMSPALLLGLPAAEAALATATGGARTCAAAAAIAAAVITAERAAE